jgi:amino acid transporter
VISGKQLRRQLRRELDEYLADLRQLSGALRTREGWLALALIVAFVALVGVLFVVMLGFDRLNDIAGWSGAWRPHLCRSLENVPALILVIDAVVVAMFGVMALGEMLTLFDNARRKLPTKARNVLIPTALMLAAGIGGVLYMQSVC